jgi:DNA topoisomerase-1
MAKKTQSNDKQIKALKTLVIVESPAKAKTIEKFLGTKYRVIASVGHIRDLPKSKMGVDINNSFEPQYINIRGKGDLIKALKKEAQKAKNILLATDPDREGEAIAWHLAHILGLNLNEDIRITFHEITKDAIIKASKEPRKIDLNLVDAQQARRILDRLVGYSISPVLWRKLKKGLSAGRVQSVATKLVCDREKLIDDFIEKRFFKVHAFLKTTDEFMLYEVNGKKDTLEDEIEVDKIFHNLNNGKMIISSVEEKLRKKSGYLPFTTSTMQMEASNKFNFSPSKTMKIAQELYEGIKLPQGDVGLITYMRTDSTRISNEAKEDCSKFILEKFGNDYLNNESRKPKENKSAQDAHEAIRPTYVFKEPNSIQEFLSKDQFKLYSLIWDRFVSSMMTDAIFNQIEVIGTNGECSFKAKSSKLAFDGYQRVYKTVNTDIRLKDYEVGEVVQKVKYEKTEHFTTPPARYTEASLVKELEDLGIGRPSTYAPTISTIVVRGYVKREKKSLIPTELGLITNELMCENFATIVDPKFTAKLESDLDLIEERHDDWHTVVGNYYWPMKEQVDHAIENIEKIDLRVSIDEKCPKCGHELLMRESKFGKFISCSDYPKCDYTRPILNEIGVKCPLCETGNVIERKSKKLKVFYGCSNFPECKFTSWDKPVGRECPKCSSQLVESNKGKKSIKCSNKECDYKELVKDE